MKPSIPEFCDFDCPFADFPPADTAGICRTMAAVWCRKLKELTNKNIPCAWRERTKRIAKPPQAARASRPASARKSVRKPRVRP